MDKRKVINGLSQQGLRVWYDADADYLEILFEDAMASMEEVEEDLFERRTPDGRVVGFAIFNFIKHNQQHLTVPLHVTATAA